VNHCFINDRSIALPCAACNLFVDGERAHIKIECLEKQANSCGAALDDSPRRKPWEPRGKLQAPEGAKEKTLSPVLSPLRGFLHDYLIPRLAPWANIYRHSVAERCGLRHAIGKLTCRRSQAAPRCFQVVRDIRRF
jgi:hypothetical protein